MVKVITYGTYDLFHYGHKRLLENAKALGDYLVVGVTSDDFDKSRGKINVKQTLAQRIEAVRQTGLADEIIVEEYEGQKIDNIISMGIDIFTVGSDWIGKFDYLDKYCKVVYLPRTEGISSSQLRTTETPIRLGLCGEQDYNNKFFNECKYVNGISVCGFYAENDDELSGTLKSSEHFSTYSDMLKSVDAVYIASKPEFHYSQIKEALQNSKHVLCESPIATVESECKELFELARSAGCILMESIKTAYSTAFHRLVLLAKTGTIGRIVSVDATCTSLMDSKRIAWLKKEWNSITAWGPTAFLPVFQILGTDFVKKDIVSSYLDKESYFDRFSKVDFLFGNASASVKVGKGIKSEGELIISGTEGYFYVPSPWWKTEYFEIRYENPADNKRFFYKLDGEGIRQELVSFVNSIKLHKSLSYIPENISLMNARIIQDFYSGNLFVID